MNSSAPSERLKVSTCKYMACVKTIFFLFVAMSFLCNFHIAIKIQFFSLLYLQHIRVSYIKASWKNHALPGWCNCYCYIVRHDLVTPVEICLFNSPISYNRYQPEKLKKLTGVFSENRWNHLSTSFWTAADVVSQESVTHSEEYAIHPCTWDST